MYAFHFMEIFHFVEMQSTFFYIFKTDWNFLMKFFKENILKIATKFYKKTISRSGDIKHCCSGGKGCTLPPPPVYGQRKGLSEKRILL